MPAGASQPSFNSSSSSSHQRSWPSSSRQQQQQQHQQISGDRSQPQPQFRVLSQAVRCFILPDKLPPKEREERYDELRALGGLVATIQYANLILTVLKAPKRIQLALHREQQDLSDEWIAQIPVLDIDWLRETAERGVMQDYDRFRVLPATSAPTNTVGKREHSDDYEVRATTPVKIEEEEGSEEEEIILTPRKKSKMKEASSSSTHGAVASQDPLAPPYKDSEYSCERPTPLVSVHNQGLVDELEIIRKERALVSQQWSERSYSGCIAAVKAYPHPICSQSIKKVRSLKGIGQKTMTVIEQYCETGRSVEATAIRNDPANAILFSFMDLYGIGPVSARTMYEAGCRTFEDIVKRGKSLATQLDVEDCLSILPDLKSKIPRKEVEEIARMIHRELQAICPGTFYEICGGYRRGKPESNDVDIVFSSEDPAFVTRRQGIIDELLLNMKKKGLMSYSVSVSHSAGEAVETRGNVDLAEIVFLPPRMLPIIPEPRHRRVDLVFCNPKIYGAAVLGWTGSRNFERDIRRWAHRWGYKLHSSGLTDQETGEVPETRTEEDVFRLLHLPWMPPHLRNCDA